MPIYLLDIWLDGYDNEEQMNNACDEFILNQLDITASSIRIKRLKNETIEDAIKGVKTNEVI